MTGKNKKMKNKKKKNFKKDLQNFLDFSNRGFV